MFSFFKGSSSSKGWKKHHDATYNHDYFEDGAGRTTWTNHSNSMEAEKDPNTNKMKPAEDDSKAKTSSEPEPVHEVQGTCHPNRGRISTF